MPRKASLGNADLESIREVGLQRQGRNQRNEIGVAAALAEAVQRSLDLPRARANRGQRIGDRVVGVVVRVNAQSLAGDDARDFGDDALHLGRQRAAIGVAEHDPPRARLERRASAFHGVGRIGLVAVEEVLAVHHRLATGSDRRADAILDARQILFQRAAERDMDVIVPRLGDEDDRVGVGGEESGDPGIVGRGAAGALGHAERAKARAPRRLALEEARVLRVGAGIAALDVIDAEFVEQPGDLSLVLEREVDPRRQRAVAQRRVEEVEAFPVHAASFSAASSARPRRRIWRTSGSSSYSPAIDRRPPRDCGAQRQIHGARRAGGPYRWRRR